MPPSPSYPTDAHARAADAIVEFFATRAETDAVLLVNSCARGKATRDSCLDIAVLNAEIARIVARQAELRTAIDAIVADLEGVK